ncbi:type ISP restriction/modification enzyme [Kribbella sp. NPDC059898]|uniref:type ISP restriction/modification enzyme n=1 Tax=Kribbella sp. NPDC059898 TaxID=3346995 RepID=UPI003663C7C3
MNAMRGTTRGRTRGTPVASPDEVIAEFGRSVARKLGRGGNPEDQLRGPLEILLRGIGSSSGLDTVAYGEVALKELRARPDYAVDVGNVGSGGARVGYIEVKAPGKGVPPRWRPAKRERIQWEKLATLPNVIYTDGLTWAHFSYGRLISPTVTLDGGFGPSGKPLASSRGALERLIHNFLLWQPESPRSLKDLIRVVAGLARLLRDEVAAILRDPGQGSAYDDLSLLASDWRDLLFPDLDDDGFSDAYAQTIAFALLLARVDGISFIDNPLHEIARQLGKKHSLMGRALAVLTEGDAAEELRTVETLRRVIEVVDWAALDDGKTDIYADLYEQFLDVYDPDLRKQSGSYYTPQEVARSMVGFVNEIIRDRLQKSWGIASDDLVVIDPAMGTGTFLVEILRSVAETIDRKQGKGARAARLREFFQQRLVGFEIQTAPYAVAELRLHEALKTRFNTDVPRTEVRFLTDALENPVTQEQRLSAPYRVIGRSRAEANRIKRETRVMVVIGNPPHVENTRGKAPWIEERRKFGFDVSARPSLDEFRTAGAGRYESDLYGLPWCFWRWAIWKTFEAHDDSPAGIVAFITPASFIRGRSFSGMREYLRRICDEGWVINLSPEGNRPPQETRIFGPAVGRQLCIAVFARYGPGDRDTPAAVQLLDLTGKREAKLGKLQGLLPTDSGWTHAESGWQSPFLPATSESWEQFPKLIDLMPWSSRGLTAGRTWVYAPTQDILTRRWEIFRSAPLNRRRQLFVESRDRRIDSEVAPLPGFPPAAGSLAADYTNMVDPIRIAYRSFDRQWVIPDNRLMVMARPPLWRVRSDRQLYVTEQSNHAIETGPALAFTNLLPDIDHYNGRSGRVMPMYRDPAGETPNLTEGLLKILRDRLGHVDVSPRDFVAYIAAVTGHGGYTTRFKKELQHPGVRIPLTSDLSLWNAAVEVGEEVLWLHTFGERYVDAGKGRALGMAALCEDAGPRVLASIPDDPSRMPTKIDHDPDSEMLIVGEGRIGPVARAVWEYEVGGMRVIRHWFDYRSGNPRHKRRSSPLDDENCVTWTPTLTDELLALLTVVQHCIELEPRQAELLERICKGQLITSSDLERASILPPSDLSRRPPPGESASQGKLF